MVEMVGWLFGGRAGERLALGKASPGWSQSASTHTLLRFPVGRGGKQGGENCVKASLQQGYDGLLVGENQFTAASSA